MRATAAPELAAVAQSALARLNEGDAVEGVALLARRAVDAVAGAREGGAELATRAVVHVREVARGSGAEPRQVEPASGQPLGRWRVRERTGLAIGVHSAAQAVQEGLADGDSLRVVLVRALAPRARAAAMPAKVCAERPRLGGALGGGLLTQLPSTLEVD